jgi:hypothetical protein
VPTYMPDPAGQEFKLIVTSWPTCLHWLWTNRATNTRKTWQDSCNCSRRFSSTSRGWLADFCYMIQRQGIGLRRPRTWHVF